MVLVVTLDLELAKQIGDAITAPKGYLLRVEGDLKEGPIWLRHQVHKTQPSVVLLDVRFGGQAFRAIEAVPRMLGTRSKPYVLLLSPRKSKALEKEAAKCGCFDVLDVSRRSFSVDVVSAVTAAELDRKAGVAPPVPTGEVPPGRDGYH